MAAIGVKLALFYRVRNEFEREYILKELERNRWNRKKTASDLGLSYRTILNKIEQFKLTPPEELSA
jgi:DNA-binding NtrC family response regulator